MCTEPLDTGLCDCVCVLMFDPVPGARDNSIELAPFWGSQGQIERLRHEALALTGKDAIDIVVDPNYVVYQSDTSMYRYHPVYMAATPAFDDFMSTHFGIRKITTRGIYCGATLLGEPLPLPAFNSRLLRHCWLHFKTGGSVY